jgi:YVTN family beta-propeller protein
MVLCRLGVWDQQQCEARRLPHRRIAETVLDAVVTLDALGYRLRALDLDCPHGVCSVFPGCIAPVRRTLASSTQAELVTTARQGSSSGFAGLWCSGWRALVGVVPDGASAVAPGARCRVTAFVTNITGGAVSTIDVKTRTKNPTDITVGTQPLGLAITPDGKTAFVSNGQGGTVSAIDVKSRTKHPTDIGVGGYPVGVAVTSDGKSALVANQGSGTVSTIDVKTWTKHPTTSASGRGLPRWPLRCVAGDGRPHDVLGRVLIDWRTARRLMVTTVPSQVALVLRHLGKRADQDRPGFREKVLMLPQDHRSRVRIRVVGRITAVSGVRTHHPSSRRFGRWG